MAIYLCKVRGHSATILSWSIGFHVSAVTNVASALASAVADGFADLWDGVPAGTNAVKALYDIGTVADDVLVTELDGALVHGVSQGLASLTLAGTAVGDPLPPQIAVVGSKLTTLPTKRGRGRLYFPPPSVASDDGGRLATADRDIYAAGLKNMLDAVRAAAGGAYTTVIVHKDFIPAAFTEFDQIKVGDVFDTQRNRRSKLKEAYTIETLA